MPGGFLTADQGFGHAVIATTAFDESVRFVTEGLGMVRSDWLQMELAPGIDLEVHFFHCNARHHTLALARAPFELPQALHHIMFETNDRDDVGRAFDRAFDAGLPLPNGLGHARQRPDVLLLRGQPGRLPGRGRPRRPPDLRAVDRTTGATTGSARWGHQPRHAPVVTTEVILTGTGVPQPDRHRHGRRGPDVGHDRLSSTILHQRCSTRPFSALKHMAKLSTATTAMARPAWAMSLASHPTMARERRPSRM